MSIKDTIQLGDIDFLHIKGDPNKPAVCLMHGYGANCEDLYPLHEYMAPENDWNWYFPNAPLEVSLGMMMSGRAWFPIDMMELQRAMMSGKHRDFRKLSSPDFIQMVERLEKIFLQISNKHKKFFLGGFSQGAMLASHLGLRLKEKVAGMILFSSNLIDEENLIQSMKGNEGKPFFQSHGEQDPLLGFDGAQALYEKLIQAGLKGEFHHFVGEHTIPWEILGSAKKFLVKLS